MSLWTGALLALPLFTQSSLEFDPRELPKAEAGSWSDLFDPEQAQERFGRVAPEVRRAFVEAQAAYGRRDLPRALDRLQLVLRGEPDMPQALKLMGGILFQIQRYGDAAECFERFLTHVPDAVWSTRHLGHCYYSLGDYRRALDHYEVVLAKMPEDLVGLDASERGAYRAEALRGRALAHMRLGGVEEALADMRRVIELVPEDADAHAWIGQILYDEGELEEAERSLDEARRLATHEPRPWFLLSKVYFEQGRDDLADSARERWRELDLVAQELRSVEADLELDPYAFELVYRKIELHSAIDNVKGVRAALDELLMRRPEDVPEVELRTYALRVLLKLDDAEGAARAAEELEARCGDVPETWKALQQYFAAVGDSLRQVEAGERYLRLRHR